MEYNSRFSDPNDDDVEATDTEMKSVGYFAALLLVGLVCVFGAAVWAVI